jgi:LacI family transcriptional regulator
MLIDDVSMTPFAAPLLDGARDEAAANDAVLSIVVTRADPGLEEAALDAMAGANLAGVIYATLVTRKVTPPARLAALRTVLLNCHDSPRHFASVCPADQAGAQAAVGHLAAAGHRRIAHLAGEGWGEAARDRTKGYRQALAAAGLAADPALLVGPVWTIDTGRSATERLLALSDPPTAIFCFNDRVAIGACEAIGRAGLRVPDDISVVGFDNEDLVIHLQPPLTTVVLPHAEMAQRAVQILLDPEDPVPPQIKVDCPLVSRASVSAPIRSAHLD